MNTASRSEVAPRAALIVAAGLYVLGMLWLGRTLHDGRLGPLLDPDPWLLALHLFGGGALLLGGVMSLASGIQVTGGVLAMLAGMTWFAPDIGRSLTDLPLARAVGAATPVLTLPLILALVVSVTVDGERARSARRVSGAVLIAGVAVFILDVLAYAPIYDPRCTVGCNLLTQMVATTGSERASLWVARELIAGTASAALLFASVPGLRLGRWRGPLGLMRIGGAVAGAAGLALVLIGVAWDRLQPAVFDAMAPLGRVTGEGVLAGLRLREIVEPLALASAAGGAMVGLALMFRVHAIRTARGRIRGIVETIATAPTPGTLGSALAAALGDAGLRIAYHIDDGQDLVAADGEPFEPGPARPGRLLRTMSRAGSPVAIVDHQGDVDPGLLSSAAGASMLVALDNERLLAAGRAQLRALRASQMRIVDLQDDVRRRVERDVHDGAQQRLLAIAFELRLARMSAESRGDTGHSAALTTAEERALAIVEELRRICRSILPQVLVEGGLGMALTALGDESPIPLVARVEVAGRPPARVEIAAYELVREALHSAVRRGATRMRVEVDGRGNDVTVEVTDPADAPVQVPERIVDRVGAVGGVVIAGLNAEGSWLRAVLPCA